MGYSFLEGLGEGRLANWATNLAAILVFATRAPSSGTSPSSWAPATSSAGTSARDRRPPRTRFVRVFFIVVVSAFIVRIGGEVLGLWS